TPQEVVHSATIGRLWYAPLEHRRSPPPPQIEPAFIGERPVGEGRSVEMDAEVDGELADRRQHVARRQPPFDEVLSQGIGDLPEGRRRRLEIDRDEGSV